MAPRMAAFNGHITSGALTLDRAAFAAELKRWPDAEVMVTLRMARRVRSLAQNAYVWSCVYAAIADHTGYDVEEVHEICKALFLPRDVAIADGNGEIVDHLVIGGSTTKLDTAQMTDYIERVRRWAADTLGVVIPDPSPLGGN